MNFLRENVFMVSLVVGTLVLGLVLVGWGYSISGQIEDSEVADRQGLSDTLGKLERGPYANGNTIMAERNRVEGILESLEAVRAENVQWNRRNFKIPQLKMLDGSMRPAFPFDTKVWDKNPLATRYIRQYHQQLEALLVAMKSTDKPTSEEVKEEALRQEQILERRQRILLKGKGMKDAKTKTAVAPRPAAAFRPDMMPPGMMPSGHGVPKRAGTSKSLSQEAMDLARATLRVRKAQAGVIYADKDALEAEFAKGVFLSSKNIKPEKFWSAQLGLWVQSDIIGAINDTIRTAQAQQKLPPEQRSVITSPIKRLLSIEVGQTQQRRKTTPKRDVRAPMMGYPQPGYPQAGYPQMRPGTPPASYRRRQAQAAPETPGDIPDTLTRNTACKVFDVVNYSFTVLMPTRYLPLLEESLMKRNYHIILNEQISPPEEATSSSSRSGASDVDSLYYYGTEPVRKVVIRGQLLLTTGFTRGQWDSEKKTWLREPLMPVEVIKTLHSSALRDEDKKLIEGRLPQPWNPSAPDPKPEPKARKKKSRR